MGEAGERGMMQGRGLKTGGGTGHATGHRLLENLCTSHEPRAGNVRTAPHPPFGHLLPQGEGSRDSIPLRPQEGGAKRRLGRDSCSGSLTCFWSWIPRQAPSLAFCQLPSAFRLLLPSALCLLNFACAHPPSAAPPAVAAPVQAPVTVPDPSPVVPTLDEVRALKAAGNLADYEKGLTSIREAATADPVQKRRATALLALFLLEQKRQDEAMALLAQAADQNPGVAPYLRLRMVDAARAAGKTADAIAAASRIVQ